MLLIGRQEEHLPCKTLSVAMLMTKTLLELDADDLAMFYPVWLRGCKNRPALFPGQMS